MEKKEKTPGRALLTLSSISMLILALPLGWWTLSMVYSTSPSDLPGDGLATWGCIVGAFAYIWSIAIAVCGLIVRKKAEKYRLCRTLGIITAVVVAVCAVMQRAVFLFTTLPLLILTILYLAAACAPLRRERGGNL